MVLEEQIKEAVCWLLLLVSKHQLKPVVYYIALERNPSKSYANPSNFIACFALRSMQ